MKLCEIKIALGSNFKHLPCVPIAIMLARMCAKIACSCTWYLYLCLMLYLECISSACCPHCTQIEFMGSNPAEPLCSRTTIWIQCFLLPLQCLNMTGRMFKMCAWNRNTILPQCTTSSMCTSCLVPPTQVLTVNWKTARPHLPVEPPQTSLAAWKCQWRCI